MSEEYFTPEEIAKKLKLNPVTVQRWLRDGKLKGAKLGKQWRVKGSDLDAFIEEGERKAREENS